MPSSSLRRPSSDQLGDPVMCHELRALRQSISLFASGFDAARLSAAQASEVVGLCARIEASAAGLKALAAARAAEAREWERYGYRSAAEQLADQAGMSAGAARRALETGQRMAGQPEVARAALAGDLSAEQAAAVSDGVAADPSKAGELIDKAGRVSMGELNEEVAKVKAEHSDLEERRRARHARRSLRRWTDREGALEARLYGHPEDGAMLWRMLDPIRRRLNVLRREAGCPNETLDTLDYDALMTMASVAIGKDGELSFTDLVGIGLFPQSPRSSQRHLSPSDGSSTPGSAPGRDPAPGQGPASDSGPATGRAPSSAPASGHSATPGAIPPGLPPDLFGTAEVSRDSTVPAGDGSGAPERAAEPTSGPATSLGEDPAVAGAVQAAPSVKRRRAKKMAGSPLRVMIRVDLDALLRGVPIEGELCEIAGYGPVPVSVIEDLIATEDPFIIGILTKHETLVGTYHHGRHPNAHQRSALDFLHPTCAVEGCSSRAGLQYDHREDFARTKITAFDLLDRLCRHHHDQKTRYGWALVAGRGKRAFVPPGDPRHPRFGPSSPGRSP